MYARVQRWTKPPCAMKVKACAGTPRWDPSTGAPSSDLDFFERFESESVHCVPRDGDLWLRRMKPEETLVEVRRDSNVQIDLQTWL